MAHSPRCFLSLIGTGLFAAFPSGILAQTGGDPVSPGEAGFYEIRESFVRLSSDGELRVSVNRPGWGAGGRLVVGNPLTAREVFEFDVFLGYLDAGDSVSVSTKPHPTAGSLSYKLVRVPAIPVSVFSEDAGRQDGGWSLISGVETSSPAARRLGTDEARTLTMDSAMARLRMEPGATGETVAAFRAPHSGYYALHDAWAVPVKGRVTMRLYAGDAVTPVAERVIETAGRRHSLNADIGYVPKGGLISLAFSADPAAGEVELQFNATVVEWAPRRAPLRVRRGADGLLDVFEPSAPRQAVDIPESRWITVPARDGDTTDEIREAILRAADFSRFSNAYAGIRLEAGATYLVASRQTGGRLFEFKGVERLVFDGNGATLRVSSPELPRKGIDLFVASDSRRVAVADLIVESETPPFATGDIVTVGSSHAGSRTVTFRINSGSPDPVAEIAGESSPSAYVYDLRHPGRLAPGVWSHYPGASPVHPTGEDGVFAHSVRRSGDSIPAVGKWLVKNKGAGVTYLVSDGKSEDITLSGIEGRAPGGGLLRFWQTSGVNLLNCRLEPQGDFWISSSADGVHGRGREGVWIEDTVLRGICEDVMNTYGLNLVVLDDNSPRDGSVVSLRVFYPGRKTPDGDFALGTVDSGVVQVGDPLVFFDPRTGRIIGRASVTAIKDGRYTLSGPVPGIERWRKSGDKTVTMVYSPRQAARFFVRDSRLMDSMRFGIFSKAEGGVVFNNQFEGLASPPIFASNEPEWPEGPPPTNLWVQGNTFSQNNTGYTIRHRDFLTVDPAEISIYTRRLRDASLPDDFRAHLVRGQYANSHVKIIGNVFHDWRGMGVAVRNARNVEVSDNLFLPPVEDQQMRDTLALDSVLAASRGRGGYACLFFEDVGGVRIENNRFVGLPDGDRPVVAGDGVSDLVENGNINIRVAKASASQVQLSFSEWFGDASVDDRSGRAVALRGVRRIAGRMGAGLGFDGAGGIATLAAAEEELPGRQLSVGLWARSGAFIGGKPQIIYAQGDPAQGITVAINHLGRLCAGVWRGGEHSWLDLGPATPDVWTHLSLVYDGENGVLRGFVDGVEMGEASQKVILPADISLGALPATFGGASILPRPLAEEAGLLSAVPYRGSIDEFSLFGRALERAEIADLSLRVQRP